MCDGYAPRRLPTPGMHFEVWIFPKPLELDQHPPESELLALLGTPVTPVLPRRGDQGANVVARGPSAQGRSEVDALLRVEAQIPHAVGCQATAVATPTERRGGRGDDAEQRG